MTELKGKEQDFLDRAAWAGQLGQDIWNMTACTGQPDRSAWTGEPRYVSLPVRLGRSAWKGQLGQFIWES
jgi:hypothetical protein